MTFPKLLIIPSMRIKEVTPPKGFANWTDNSGLQTWLANWASKHELSSGLSTNACHVNKVQRPSAGLTNCHGYNQVSIHIKAMTNMVSVS